MFKSIVINKENFKGVEVTLSTPRTAEDSEGNEFTYYWLTIGNYICCTGQKFTSLLPEDAKDADAVKVIKENEGKFQISQAVDEDDEPIFINDDNDTPLLKITAKPHSVALDW